ncbi:MAG: efflux RND transporter permease subunit [Pseudomonadota bacterium]|nr:efflux RND transporter permease subunit [Pseudomonadota bacterium]
MNISDIAIRRPVFTAMVSLAILVMGFLSLDRLGTDLYPPVAFPFMTVQVVYPGASPADIERDVTRPIEDAVAGISGIETLQGFARDSYTLLLLKFAMGTDLEAATNAVRDRIGAVEGKLPAGAEKPVIQQIDIGALPVVVLALSSDGTVNETRAMADERLRPFLEQVPGVGAVNVIGGQDREVQVNLDLDRLRALDLAPADIARRIGYENVSVPVGSFAAGAFDVAIRSEGQLTSVDDLRSVVVSMTREGKQVRLGEVADVIDGWSDAKRYVRNNGRSAVALEIVKKSGANTVTVADGAMAALAEVIPTLGNGAAYEIIADQSRDVRANAHEVWIAIFFGGAMAIFVIYFFLLDVRGTLISALALPTSIVGTFAAMYALGFSLNMMTLIGMSLAIGLLIDDAVVVRESITRRLEAGDSPAEAASRGTSEVALAVLATTLSLVAVFVPVAFMSGIVGQFFKQFGLTIAVAVLLSLFVAFTLDPMLSARLSTRVVHGKRKGLAGVIERFLDTVDDRYRRMLEWVLGHQWTTVGVTLLLLAGTVGIALQLPTEFMPKEDRGEIFADIRLPVGTDLEVTDAVSRAVEADLLKLPGIERVYSIVGHENQPNRTRFRIRAIDKTKRTDPLSVYENAVRARLDQVPQAEVTLSAPGIIEGLGDWPPILLIIQGEDLAGLLAEGERLKAMMQAVPGTSDVRLTIEPGQPELTVRIDRAVASDRGIPAGLAGSMARLLVEGELVGTLRDGGDEADIRVRAAGRFTDDLDAIRALPVPSPRGLVTLGEIANVEMGAGASEIARYNRMRSVTVTSQVANGAALGAVVEGFNAALLKAPLPEGYFLTLDGQAKDMTETGAAMGLAIGVAAIFVFMVLASQFESLLHPFTLLLSVPLAMVGAFVGLFIAGQSISMGSQIGIILLMGLVTKNAILLVDGALQFIRDGHTAEDAIRLAGPRRLRPILMTSAAMVLGMIPTAISTGVGSEFRAPMAVSVIGGVLSSTVLTVFVVPVAFLWVERQSARLAALWARFNPDAVEAPHAVADADAAGSPAAK